MKEAGLQDAKPREDDTIFSNLAQIDRVEATLGKGSFLRLAQV